MVENVKELLKLHEGIKHEVYLDNENSTMVPQEVLDAMLPYYNKKAYGNPTLTHKPGWEAFTAIMESSPRKSPIPSEPKTLKKSTSPQENRKPTTSPSWAPQQRTRRKARKSSSAKSNP